MSIQRDKGSLSVFSAISFMLIAQFLFVVLEASRYEEMKKVTEIQSRAQEESLFAEYCIPLWEQYHLLACDLDTDYIRVMLNESAEKYAFLNEGTILSSNSNFVRAILEDVDISNLELITDEDGQIFEAEVSSYMKNNITYEAARRIYDRYNSLGDLTESSDYEEASIDDALDVINNPENYQNEETTQSCIIQQTSSDSGSGTGTSNSGETLSDVRNIQQTGILALVLDSNVEVSDKSIEDTNVVSKRTLSSGTNVARPQNGWYDKILMEQYIESYMSSFRNPNSDRALEYEIEYIVCGKSSDEANLKSVVNKILAIREAANYVYILSDAAKMAEVTALAASIGGATLNPAAILLIKAGLIAAWAYCESILDVRALLQGDKIPIIKSSNTWTSGLSGISTLLSGNAKAISSEQGISYQNYLGFLLMAQSTSKSAYRTMDMQEKTINCIEGYENVKMDKMFCKLGVNMDYNYSCIFAGMVNLVSNNLGMIKIRQNAKYAYF